MEENNMDMDRRTKINDMIFAARSWTGAKYKRGARPRFAEEFRNINDDKNPEFADCSSLIAYAFWKTTGQSLIPCSFDMAADVRGVEIASIKEAAPGDLLFFKGEVWKCDRNRLPYDIGHVAMMTYNGYIIHCLNSSGKSGVVEHPFTRQEHHLCNPSTILLIKRFL